MEVINLSKKRFESLEPYELPANIFNTEAKMYTLPIKNRWQTVNKILKDYILLVDQLSATNCKQSIHLLI